jgi:hypothetical protein
MAKTIEPISSWQNGEEKQATLFQLNSSFDNLATTANFQYQLTEIISTTTPPTSDSTTYNTLVSGMLTMSGQDYLDWDAATDVNEWAYTWAATQLKLTITGNYVPPAPPEPTPEPTPIIEETIA